MSKRIALIGLLLSMVTMACNDDPAATPPTTTPPTDAAPPTDSPVTAAADSGPTATICDDIGKLIEAARTNFPDLRHQDKPVSTEYGAGFEAKFVVPNTIACRILTSPPPYPDAYECDLAPTESQPKAKEMVDRWASVVGQCPQLADWKPTEPNEFGRSWEIETGDNHQLAVQLFTQGDDNARPTLIVRLNEI